MILRRLVYFSWQYPEWWAIILSGFAWVTSLAMAQSDVKHANHMHAAPSAALQVGHWLLMVMAMMFPLLLPSIRAVAARSLWARRHRSIIIFLIGYLFVWAVAGTLISTALYHLRFENAHYSLLYPALAITVVWQITPCKLWSLRRCHRTAPLAPDGLRAEIDCLRFGAGIGCACVFSCWPVMLACAVADSAFGMMCATTLAISERYITKPDRVSLLFTAVGCALLWLLSSNLTFK
jgi:predicted metal-binding membrane protein